jgi:hypothetical protein
MPAKMTARSMTHFCKPRLDLPDLLQLFGRQRSA